MSRTPKLDMACLIVYIVGMAELLGTFEQAVLLTVLRLGEEAYGRAVLRGVEAALGRTVAAGAVYATLDRTEQKGLLSSRLAEGTAARSGRARRYYRLTAIGVAALNESRSALQRLWRGAKSPLERPA